GYLIKTDRISDIAGKLRIMMDGAGVLSADALKKLTLPENPVLQLLTQREQDITRLVAQGLSNKDIAARLFLSEGTVRNNIVVIMEKLCVTNRTQLGMAYYMEMK
ncbi:MAG: DNA-binding response regulator, partial [Lachnospiraceae bacterium]|nr:DNA-binding response regulator [Lachnospiraceae bacterium]